MKLSLLSTRIIMSSVALEDIFLSLHYALWEMTGLLYLYIGNVDDNNETMCIYTGSLQTSLSLYKLVCDPARIHPEKQKVNRQSSDNFTWKR